MIIVDDHLALLAIAGSLRGLEVEGPIATTWPFQFRLARALLSSARGGTLSRSNTGSGAPISRVLHPPADRLVVLDPRSSIDEAARVAERYSANLLFADLLGSALRHQAAVRVTPANVGRTWIAAMASEGIDFATIEP